MARQRQVSNEQILRVARKCFVKHGPSLSTEVIADKLGVSQPALFKRFKSKRELMIAALAPPEVAGWISELQAGPDDRPFREQLEELANRVTDYFRDISPCLSVLSSSGIPPKELMQRYAVPPPIAAIRSLTDWLERCAHKGLIRKTEFEATAMAMLGSLHFQAFLSYVTGQRLSSLSRRSYIEACVELYARGLEPNPKARTSRKGERRS